MGEYYCWANTNKKQCMWGIDFDYGSKYWESMGGDDTIILALQSLLNDEWKGDRIVWLGDESLLQEDIDKAYLKNSNKEYIEFINMLGKLDVMSAGYKNVSGLFKEAKENVMEEIGYYLDSYKNGGSKDNEYGIDVNKPFDGLFTKTGKRYKYLLNHSKKVFYSFGETDLIDNRNGEILDWDASPLPSLMSYGSFGGCGEWLRDIIGVSDERPNDYKLLNSILITI